MSEEHHSDMRGEDLRLLERRVRRLQALLRIYRWGLALAILTIGTLMVLLFYAKAPPLARAILIDGKQAALVRSEKAAAAVRQRLLAVPEGGDGRATFRESWQDATRRTDGENVLSVADAVRLLKDKVTVLKEAFAIEASGNQLVVVPTREMAQAVLDRLKARYASPTDAVVRMTRLRPQPAIRPCAELPSRIVTDVEHAVSRLTSARSEQSYVVKPGDYVERIAAANGMTPAEFWALNADLRGQTLHPGERVRVISKQGGLVVVTVKETVTMDTIPAGTRRETTVTLPQGQTRVQTPGRAGQRRVRWEVTMSNDREVARRPLSQEVIVEPRPQVVLVGTR